ncbi:MAG TPA: dCMP deaminase family protein [Candidatus Eubacterium faecipullorum]|uniref:dCMP deaminase family protein n=1 Tax=Candidatus Eubacterium faecipullorum TaxID=2838571 RepID=A0A9D1REL5_9FIRM|nr:dCMP deaminase family protein [Candidatus Eubacterium faecipullorum]
MAKREDYISWDEYFMGVALLSAMRSKDPNTQVGACIVNDDNRIVSVGYNGFPRGCSDEDFPWERSADNQNDTKYPFVCHAELNAILNSNGIGVKGSRIYVALFPCNECAKAIIQAGIKEIVYISDKYRDTDANLASKRMLAAAGVKLTEFKSTKKLEIDFEAENI